MKRVLIALDYNPTAQKVAEVGFAFAKSMGAEVVLLHVISEPVFYAETYMTFVNIGALREESIGDLKEHAEHFLEESKRHLGDNDIVTAVRDGEFAPAIISAAKEFMVDAIVLGSHGHRWLEEVLVGSVTEKVLHQSTIPLFIIPTKDLEEYVNRLGKVSGS